MLRFLVLLLLLANGAYFAWSQGLLSDYGFAPVQQTEPLRITQQIKPERLRILKADELKRLEVAAQSPARPTECLHAGVFDASQTAELTVALQNALPAGSWALDAVVEPARWIIYMGKYPSAEALAKKRSELASLNLNYEPLTNPSLEFGLSLGGYAAQSAADAALAALSRRGVRTARVVQERAELRGSSLRIAAVDELIRARLDELRPLRAGKTLRTSK